MENYKNIIRLGRPQNTRFSIFLLVSVAIYSRVDTFALVALVGSYFFSYQLVTLANNIFDQRTDRINENTQNPLIKSLVNRNQVKFYALVVSIALITILIYLQRTHVTLVITCSLAVGAWYSLPNVGAAYRNYLGTAVLAFWYAALPTLLVWGYGADINAVLMQMTIIQILLTASWLLTKDYKDEVGDKAVGKLTPLIKFGAKNVLTGSLILIFTAIIGVIMTGYSLKAKTIILFLCFAYAYIVFNCHRNKTQSHRTQAFLILGMIQLTALLLA